MLQGLRTHINIIEAVGTTVATQLIAAKEDAVRNADEIGKVDAEAMSKMI